MKDSTFPYGRLPGAVVLRFICSVVCISEDSSVPCSHRYSYGATTQTGEAAGGGAAGGGRGTRAAGPLPLQIATIAGESVMLTYCSNNEHPNGVETTLGELVISFDLGVEERDVHPVIFT
jgi:hypothetical protein